MVKLTVGPYVLCMPKLRLTNIVEDFDNIMSNYILSNGTTPFTLAKLSESFLIISALTSSNLTYFFVIVPSEYRKSNTVPNCPLIRWSAISRFDVSKIQASFLILRFRARPPVLLWAHAWKLLIMSTGYLLEIYLWPKFLIMDMRF